MGPKGLQPWTGRRAPGDNELTKAAQSREAASRQGPFPADAPPLARASLLIVWDCEPGQAQLGGLRETQSLAHLPFDGRQDHSPCTAAAIVNLPGLLTKRLGS